MMLPLSEFERFLRSGRRNGVGTPPPSSAAWDMLQERLVTAGASQVTPASRNRDRSPWFLAVLVFIAALLVGLSLWWWSPNGQGPQDKSVVPVVLPVLVPADTTLSPVGPLNAITARQAVQVELTDTAGTLSVKAIRKTDNTITNISPKRIADTATGPSGQATGEASTIATSEIKKTALTDSVFAETPAGTLPYAAAVYRAAAVAAARPLLVRDKILIALPDPVLQVVPITWPLDKLPTVRGEKVEYGYTGKPKARAEWQVIAAYNSVFSYYPYGFGETIYTRGPTAGSARTFVLPNGESIPAGFLGSRESTAFKANSFFFRSGISRQMADGFYFSAELGAYKSYSRRRNNDYYQVAPDEIRLDYDLTEFIMTYSLSMQYTFLKRHRFRPYIGVQGLGFLYYYGRNETTFFDGQTQTVGLDRRFTTRQYFPETLDYALLAGIQYKFTQRLSAGVSLFANSGYDYFLEAPVGIEVRYSLK